VDGILKDINAVVGVTGCFVCDSEGLVLASALPELFDENILSTVGRIMNQTFDGLTVSRRRTTGDIDLIFENGRFIAKNLGEASLFILCTRDINVPLLNLTAIVTARKLSSLMKTRIESEKTQDGKPVHEENLRSLAKESMGESRANLLDSELAKAGLDETAQ